jgi:tetratricopeptide (TPR) repeat protein
MSYALDYSLWGLSPKGYHLTNLLLHGANAAAAFLLIRRLVLLSRPAEGETVVSWAAAAAAAWWAWHPARVESVAWVSQRRDLLASLLILCSCLSYLRARAAAPGEARRRWDRAAFWLFALSLFAKSIGAVLPAALVALDVYPLRRKESWRRLVWDEKKLSWILSVAFLATAALAQKAGGAAVSLASHPWGHRLAQAFYGLAHGAVQAAVPLLPRLVEEFPVPFRPASGPFLVSYAAVAAAAFLLWRFRRKLPAAGTAAAVFAVFLAPTLGFLQSGPQITASRYTYLASLAPAALLAGAAAAARGSRRAAWAAALALLTLSGAAQARRRLPAWRDARAFWEAAVEESPFSVLAWCKKGQLPMARELWLEALSDFDRALSNAGGRPSAFAAEALANRGYVLLRMGRRAEAEADLRAALDQDPSKPEARSNLGLALMGDGRRDEALAQLAEAARRAPDFAEGRLNYGVGLARAGRPAEALAEFDAAAALSPGLAAPHYNRALLLGALGRTEEARQAWQEAARLDPSLPPLPPGSRR